MITSENTILIEKNRKLRESHEEAIKRANKSYIAELREKLDKKDVQTLKFIHLMKIATTEQLAKMIYPDSNSPDKSMQKKMRKLFSYGCVDKFAPRKPIGEGSPQNHYVLARPGAKIIELKEFRTMTKLNQNWRHTVGIAEAFVYVAIKYTVYEWRQELKLKYTIGSNEHEVRPDVFSHWVNNDRDYFSFFEIDMGTESQDILNKKINAYNDYFYRGDEFKKAHWQPYDQPIILPIVFVLNSEKRLNNLKKYYDKFIKKYNSKLLCYFFHFDNLNTL